MQEIRCAFSFKQWVTLQIQNMQKSNNVYMQGIKISFLFKVITVLFLCSLVPKTKWICSLWPNFCQDPDTWREEWVSSWRRSYWGFLEPWKAWAGEAFKDHETTLSGYRWRPQAPRAHGNIALCLRGSGPSRKVPLSPDHLSQRSAHFFHEGSGSRYFGLCRPRFLWQLLISEVMVPKQP